MVSPVGSTDAASRARPNPYYHERQLQQSSLRLRLQTWGFDLLRSDDTVVRMHPELSTREVAGIQLHGHDVEVEAPCAGLGQSDGRYTFAKYKKFGVVSTLKFCSHT